MADNKKARIWDWTVGAALAALAALVYFLSMASYAYPARARTCRCSGAGSTPRRTPRIR